MTTHAFVDPFNATTNKGGEGTHKTEQKDECRSAAVRLEGEGGNGITRSESLQRRVKSELKELGKDEEQTGTSHAGVVTNGSGEGMKLDNVCAIANAEI